MLLYMCPHLGPPCLGAARQAQVLPQGILVHAQRAYGYVSTAIRSAYVSIRQHTTAYVSIRQHTSAYVSIRQHTGIRPRVYGYTPSALILVLRQHTSAHGSIRQHTHVYC
jgi:hypothetical protein